MYSSLKKPKYGILTIAMLACCEHGASTSTFMTLVSNQENTEFELRALGDSDWKKVGAGKILQVAVREKSAYEVAATPRGYRRKEMTLPTPVSELRFTFEISDRLDVNPAIRLEIDVRVVSIQSSETTVAVNERAANPSVLREAIHRCVASLSREQVLHGTLAVLPFVDSGYSDGSRYGETASSMLISALKSTKRDLRIMERTQLDRILAEHDLSAAAIVKSPAILGAVSEIDYLVIGTISGIK